MTIRRYTFSDNRAPWAAPVYLASSGALMSMPKQNVVAHVADLLLHAILLDRRGMPIVAEIQRTRAAVVKKEFSL